MKRLICAALLLAAPLVGCGDTTEPDPAATDDAPAAADAAADSATPDADPDPDVRPTPPPLPGAMPPPPSAATSPSVTFDRYLDGLRAGDGAATGKHVLFPEDATARSAAEDRLELLAGKVASGKLSMRVLRTRVTEGWAVTVLLVTDSGETPPRASIEPRYLRTVDGAWLVLDEAPESSEDAAYLGLLDWFEGAKSGFEAEHL